MKRYEVTLPKSGYKTTAMAGSNERVEVLERLGWKCRLGGRIEAIES